MVLHAVTQATFKTIKLKQLFFLFLMFSHVCFSQFKVDKSFSDNMVLQCEKPFSIFGKGIPGKKITLQFSTFFRNSSIVKRDSSWEFKISAQHYSSAPFKFVVDDGSQKLVMNNILFGDVWICTGQSNMEFPLSNDLYVKENNFIDTSPNIRILNPTYIGKDMYGKSFSDSMNTRLNEGNYYEGSWQICNSIVMKKMSAIGYYFAKKVHAETGIPIGIVNISVGGSPIESWINSNSLASSGFATKTTDARWTENENLPVWIRQRAVENIGTTNKVHAFQPGYIYDHGIFPLMKLPIKGILWYQGESNSQEIERVKEYPALMKMMVADYRKGWNDAKLPFYVVQLSSIDTLKYKSQYWPLFRSNQLLSYREIKNTGIAVSTDIGDRDNVHPRDKRTVADRLSRWALHDVYNRNIIVSGPIPRKAVFKNNSVIIKFKFAEGLNTSDQKTVRGFSLNGTDQIDASIVGKNIQIRTSSKPELIHYSYKPFSDANLVNIDGLPTPSFILNVKK